VAGNRPPSIPVYGISALQLTRPPQGRRCRSASDARANRPHGRVGRLGPAERRDLAVFQQDVVEGEEQLAGDHVVIGAGGGTGSAVVRELGGRGLRVRAVTRSGKGDVSDGVQQMAADIGTPEGARRACEGAAVVYHCAQPPYTKWLELFPPLTGAVLDGAAEAGAKLVFADNMYVYGPPDGPMTEETPQRAQGKKGRTRVQMADAVLGAHADGRLRVTIGHSSDYYGPRGTTSTVGENIMEPALHGKRVRWLGSLDQPHTLNYLEDMGRGLVTLGERDEADGQVWHLG
jgi:nucleoside-diphosphate-sugar epimerase